MNPYVWGVGSSSFGKHPHLSASQLAWSAILEAIRDAEVSRVDAVYLGPCFAEVGIAPRTLQGLGIVGIPIVTRETAWANTTVPYYAPCARTSSGRCAN